MKIFFWDFQDDNDIVRQWLMFALNSLVLIFTGFALFSTWKHYKRCMFEMMPLSINFFATFILLNLKLFEKGYQFQYIGHVIEIFTYFLFCYTFAIMYTLISDPKQKIKVQRFWNIVLVVMLLLLILFLSLVFASVISKKCQQQTQQWPAIFGLAFQFISFVPTVFYGIKILRRMMGKEQHSQAEGQYNDSAFTSEIYIKERKKQIVMVLTTYFISLIIRLIVTILTIFFWDSLFQCKQVDDVFVISSKVLAGQFVLLFAQINQLLPHVVIPIAMFVVPLQKMTRSKSIKLHEGLLDEDEQESDHSQEEQIQNRVSTLLTSRLSQDSSPLKRNMRDRDVSSVVKIQQV